MNFEAILRYLSMGSVLIPIGMSLGRLRPLSVRFPSLLAYLGLSLLVESWGLYTSLSGAKNNLLVYNFFNIAELILLSGLYYRAFDGARFRQLVLIINALYVPFALYRFTRAPDAYDGLVLALENFLLILLVLLYFYQLLNNLEVTRLSRFPMFWISTGILMFFAGSLFIYLFSNYILTRENYPALRDLWNVTHYLNIVFHLALAAGIWHTR